MRSHHQGKRLMRMFMKELFLLIFLIVKTPLVPRFLATPLNKRGKRKLANGKSLYQRLKMGKNRSGSVCWFITHGPFKFETNMYDFLTPFILYQIIYLISDR